MQILLVKLGALGDVLRTTPLLTALKRRHPGARVHWVVEASCAGVLKENIEDEMERAAALIRHLGQLAVLEWEGVGDENGTAAPVTPKAVAALFDLWPVAEAFERIYLTPALLLEQEKNA